MSVGTAGGRAKKTSAAAVSERNDEFAFEFVLLKAFKVFMFEVYGLRTVRIPFCLLLVVFRSTQKRNDQMKKVIFQRGG